MILGIVAILAFCYIWGDIRIAFCIALGFALAKLLMKK